MQGHIDLFVASLLPLHRRSAVGQRHTLTRPTDTDGECYPLIPRQTTKR